MILIHLEDDESNLANKNEFVKCVYKMETKDIQFIKEASANGYDGELYWFRVMDNYNEKFDFFIPITRSALCCKGLKDINRQDLLKGFQDQILEILVKFSPSNFTNDNGIVPHRFTFAIIDSDYAVYGINCLSAINKAHGIKVKVNVN